MFQFGGAWSFVWGDKPPKAPRGDGADYIPICCVKYQGDKGPQQQLIYLQVWLSAIFSNRY